MRPSSVVTNIIISFRIRIVRAIYVKIIVVDFPFKIIEIESYLEMGYKAGILAQSYTQSIAAMNPCNCIVEFIDLTIHGFEMLAPETMEKLSKEDYREAVRLFKKIQLQLYKHNKYTK